MTEYRIEREYAEGFERPFEQGDDPHRVLRRTPERMEWSEIGEIFNQVDWWHWFYHVPGTWDQPEARDVWAEQYPERVLSGTKAAMCFTFYRSHDAGMLRFVPVLPGQVVAVSAFAHAWSAKSSDDGHFSDGAGTEVVSWPEGSQPTTNGDDPWQDAKSNFTFWVGIDPTGGADPLADTVIWSAGWHNYNGYPELPICVAVEVPPGSTEATIFLRSRAQWAFKHNDAYWDDVTVRVMAPVVEAAESWHKIGLHVLRNGGGVPECLAAGAPLAVFNGDFGMAAALPSNVLAIGKVPHQSFDAQSLYKSGRTPREAAEFLIEEDRKKYAWNPAIEYWGGFNEPVWETAEEMAWYTQEEIERILLLEELGLRAVIGEFSTGTPPLGLWEAFVPALEFGLAHEAILGLHEYSTPWLWWMTGAFQVDPTEDQGDEGWSTLRYRKVIRQVLEPHGLGALRIAITELGLDKMVLPRPPGCPGGTWQQLGEFWREHDGQEDKARYYADQLGWYGGELEADPQVVGAAVFCAGNFGKPWSDFDVADSDAIGHLAEYAREAPAPEFVYALDPEPAPPAPGRGAPRVDYERTFVLMPPGAGVDLWRAVVDVAVGARWAVGGSADDAGVGDLSVRRVIAVNPDAWPGDLEEFYAEYYAGVEYVPVVAAGPDELRAALERIAAGGAPEEEEDPQDLRGVHDLAGGEWMKSEGITGWCLEPLYLNTSSMGVGGLEELAAAGVRVILNLRYSYAVDDGGRGTMPGPDELIAFEAACIETMERNPAAWGFVYANEMNNPREWPSGYALTPEYYAASYQRLRTSKPVGARLSPGAIDPYNPGWRDWRLTWSAVLEQLDAEFVALHAYTHGPETARVWSTEMFGDAPLTGVYYDLRVVESQRQILPRHLAGLPVVITETNHLFRSDGEIGWNDDGAWVAAAFEYFGQQGVAGACLFRYGFEDWRFSDLPNVLAAMKRL